MKRLLGNIALAAIFSLAAFGATFKGVVMDTMCAAAKKDPATHTRQCALGCAQSGYGLVMADGTFLKFDKAGNAKALAALKASTKADDLTATVEGTKSGDMIKVKSVKLD
jgi:phage terminase large subunit-like protein